MFEKKRHFILYCVLIVVVGVSIGVSIGLSDWADFFIHYASVFAIVLGIGTVLCLGIFLIAYYQCWKINSLTHLFNEGLCDTYMERMKRLQRFAISSALKHTCTLNIVAAYSDMGDDAQALALLLTIPEKKLLGDTHDAYHLNRAALYFSNQQNKEGLLYYQSHLEHFEKLTAHPTYEPYVETLKIYVLIEQVQIAQATEKLEFVREKFNIEKLQRDFTELQHRIDEATKT